MGSEGPLRENLPLLLAQPQLSTIHILTLF
jgi:hypothetical protein